MSHNKFTGVTGKKKTSALKYTLSHIRVCTGLKIFYHLSTIYFLDIYQMVKELSESNNILNIEYWGREIQRMRLIYLNDIMKVDPQLAEIGNVILYNIIESAQCLNNQVELQHIICDTRMFKDNGLWLNRVNQLKQSKSMYGQIEDSIKQFEKLIDKFYDVFIGSNTRIKSAL